MQKVSYRPAVALLVAGLFSAPLTARAVDIDLPVIKHTVPQRMQPGMVRVDFEIFDQSLLFGVIFHWREVGEVNYKQISFPTQQKVYTAEFIAQQDFEFWIEAYDEHGNGPALDGTAAVPNRIKVGGEVPPPPPPPADNKAPVAPPAPELVDAPLSYTRLSRTAVASVLPGGVFEARLDGGLQFGGDFLVPGGSLFGQSGAVHLSYGVLDLLQFGVSTAFRSSTISPLSSSLSVLGDVNVNGRIVSGPLGAARIGLALSMDLQRGSGRTDHPQGVEPSGFAVSPAVQGFASVSLPQVRLHLNGGYRWDNSASLLKGQWPSVASYGLGLSRYDQLSFGLGAEFPLGLLSPFIEWSLEIPLDRRRFSTCTPEGTTATCGQPASIFPAQAGQLPQRLGLGTRVEFTSRIGLDFGFDISLTRASRGLSETDSVPLLALEGSAPPPPFAARLNFVWQFGSPPPQQAPPKAKTTSSDPFDDTTF